MKKQLPFLVLVFLGLSFLSSSLVRAESQPQCKVNGECTVQRMPAGEADHECLHSEKMQRAEGDKGSDLLGSYFAILSSLSQDSLDGVQANAKDLADTMNKLAEHCAADKEKCGKNCQPDLLTDAGAAAKALAGANDIGEARSQFGVVSEKLVEFLKDGNEGTSGKLYVYRCDMAKKVWLQKDEEPANPYFGPSMAKCRRKID